MKKVLSVILVVAVIACIGVGFSGCDVLDEILEPKLDKQIIGTWVTEDSSITFREDGTVTMSLPFLSSVSVNGTYTVNNETNQVTVTYNLILGLSQTSVFNVSIEDDVLTAIGGFFDTTMVYTRQVS